MLAHSWGVLLNTPVQCVDVKDVPRKRGRSPTRDVNSSRAERSECRISRTKRPHAKCEVETSISLDETTNKSHRPVTEVLPGFKSDGISNGKRPQAKREVDTNISPDETTKKSHRPVPKVLPGFKNEEHHAMCVGDGC